MSTQIQWTEETWNPVTGCSKVSPGCAHCYAEGVAARFWPTQYAPVQELKDRDGDGYPRQITVERPREFTDVMTHADRLDQPLRWKRPRKVFVNSMSDLFHEAVPDAFIDRVFAVMALAPQHTFQILTKRAERMREYAADTRHHGVGFQPDVCIRIAHAAEKLGRDITPASIRHRWPLPNVWLGVSVENQRFADERIPLLLQTPAAVRFISAEPLLGPVDLHGARYQVAPGTFQGAVSSWKPSLDWVICGGESGSGARPFDVAWARSIVQQCQAAGVPVFVKQLGARPQTLAGSEDIVYASMVDYVEKTVTLGEPATLRLRDRKGGDPSEWPEDLRVRQFPEARG